MKIKTTRKAIVNSSENLVSVGYCDLQTLLRNHSPIAYTSGVYGWNFDVFKVYGMTICTGYRGMPGRRANNIGEYEAKARAVYDDKNISYKEMGDKIEALLKEFCEQAYLSSDRDVAAFGFTMSDFGY